MADLLGAIVIAAGTVLAAYVNAAAHRSKDKAGAQKLRQASKAKRRKPPTAPRAGRARGNSVDAGSSRQRGR